MNQDVDTVNLPKFRDNRVIMSSGLNKPYPGHGEQAKPRLEMTASSRHSLIESGADPPRRQFSSGDTSYSQVASLARRVSAEQLPRLNQPEVAVAVKWYLSGPKFLDVFKSSLAYTVATLFVCTRLTTIFGTTGSKHLVATVSVWFHATRTIGSMVQLIATVSLYLLFALIVASLSMIVAHWFGKNGHNDLGALATLLLFYGPSMAAIGFAKIQWASPPTNTACSIAILFLVNVLIKEDDVHKGIVSFDQLQTYFLMMVVGLCVSTSICFAISPSWAIRNFCRDTTEKLHLESLILVKILDSFTNGTCVPESDFVLLKSKADQMAKTMPDVLMQSYFEFFIIGFPEKYDMFAKLLESLQRISLHVGALAHCTNVQAGLINSNNVDESESHLGANSIRMLSSAKSAKQSSTSPLFYSFLYHLGPPVESLVLATTRAMSSVSFSANADDFEPIIENLQIYIHNYKKLRSAALEMVYNHRAFKPDSEDTNADDESLVATCGMFSYVLQDMAAEVQNIVKMINAYRSFSPHRSWSLRFLSSMPKFQKTSGSQIRGITESLYPIRESDATGSFRFKLWRMTQVLKLRPVRHGLKVALGGVVIAAPAFTPSLRPVFQEWHGEWSVVTYMLIMARNFGAMTKNIPLRIGGTILGASLAVAVWPLVHNNAFMLLTFGFIVSTLCFYIILGKACPVAGRFILLAYNLVCLYSYSLAHNDWDAGDADNTKLITEIAFHRVIAVVIGIVWAVFMTVVVFPHSARYDLRLSLSALWMRLGLAWKADPLSIETNVDEPHSAVYRRVEDDEKEFQDSMLNLHALLDSAPNEFRLRGKFNKKPYQKMLGATQIMLEAYYSIKILIKKDLQTTPNELELLSHTATERYEVCSIQFLQLYTAATSIRLGFPMPDHLPEPINALSRLLETLQKRRHHLLSKSEGKFDQEDFIRFYSYILVALTVETQLLRISGELRDLYGALDAELFANQ